MRKAVLKWMIVVGGACLATAVLRPRLTRAADHLDAPATTAEAAADINDVYAFRDTGDATKIALAMTVFPAATTASKFSDAVQYVIRTQSGAAFGTVANDFNIICTFNAAQTAQCWAGASEYLTGDASAATGIASKDGKVKIFAGLRKDPFFFNLLGFRNAVKAVKGAIDGGTLVSDSTGCPDLTGGTGNAVAGLLKTNPDGGGAPEDFFKTLNTLAIVVQIDKALVTAGGPIMAVSGSTHRKP